MTPHVARPLLHSVHVLTFLILLVTGVLLFVPGLRAFVTGGYSVLIRAAHRWGGVAYILLPCLIVARAGVRTTLAPAAAAAARRAWSGLHTSATVAMTLTFTVTGFVLWEKRFIPEAAVDLSRDLHDWLTYAAAAVVILHLLAIGLAAVLARVSAGAEAARAARP